MLDWYSDTQTLVPGSVSAAALPGELQPAWDALGCGATAYHGVEADASPGFAMGILINQAPRSQFVALQELLHQGTAIPDGLIAVAGQGSGFRGQRERAWIALPGNLHGCWYRRVDRPAPELGQGLAMLPTLAVVDALAALIPEHHPPGIKWVNDVIWQGKKVAGCLVATRVRQHRIEDVLVGIGINVATAPVIAEGSIHPPAGCVHDVTGRRDLAWPAVLRALTGHLNRRFEQLLREGPGGLFHDYRERSCAIGNPVRLWPQEEGAGPLGEGILRDIAPDLALEVDGFPGPVRDARMTLMD